MSDRDWQRIWSLFHAARERAEAERPSFLEQHCQDESLRRQVWSLLEAGEGEGILDGPSPLADAAGPESRPEIPGYRIERLLGAGGMGAVYLAREEGELERPVALKLIKRGMDTDQVIARFEAERQTLARMNHPGIASIYGAGSTPGGRPYFVMEWVPGEPIDRYADRQKLDTGERLALLEQVCDAVQHAHQKGVIHRDLKPSNVLVSSDEGRHRITVIDFGVARAVEADGSRRALFTETGQIVGTPEYMSPEQAAGGGAELDTRSDVYSLGVLLYQLLVGALPFDPASLRGAGYDEIRRLIREQDPPTPSHRFSSLSDEESGRLARMRGANRTTMNRVLRGELDWITMRAMAKEPGRRYASASELGSDLQRYRRREPVSAGPPTAGYRLRRFVARHKLGVTAAVLAGVLLTGFAFAMAVQVLRTRQALAEAEAERARAEEISRFLVDVFETSDPRRALGQEPTAREVLDAGARRIDSELLAEPRLRAALMETLGQVYWKLGLFTQARLRYQKALALRRAHGPLSEEAAETLHMLGILNRELGEYEPAESRAREALALRRRLHGDLSPEVASSLNSLAVTLRFQGRLDEAEERLRECLRVHDELGEQVDPAQRAAVHNTLGAIHKDRGHYAEARSHYETALELRLTYQDDDPLAIAAARNNLASLLYRIADYAGAETHFRAMLELHREVLGEDHPETGTAYNNLATALSKQGRQEQAIALKRRALAIREKSLGPDHVEVAVTRFNLGRSLSQLGRYEDALAQYRITHRIFLASYGAEHPRMAIVGTALAEALFETGDVEGAAPVLEEADRVATTAWPEGHAVLADLLTVRARLALAEGRSKAAIEAARQALAMREELLETGDWRIAEGRSLLGAMLAETGGAAEQAQRLLQTGYDGLLDAFGADDPRTRRAALRMRSAP